MIILKLCERDYSVVSSILVMAQGLELNIRREEIIKSSQMKREEERISFLSSHNLYYIVKGLTELCKKSIIIIIIIIIKYFTGKRGELTIRSWELEG